MAIPTLNLGNTPTNPGWRYAAAIALLTPFVLGFNAFRAFRMGDRRYFFERLGHGGIPNCDAPLWIHAASVGEVHATRPLVSGIRHARAELPILVTTVTPTGAAAVARLGKGVHHCYLPWDSKAAVRRFLQRFQPRCAVVFETELWPHLYHECYRSGIAPLIVNGRLTAKTMSAPAWLAQAYLATLNNCSAVLARSEVDAKRFRQLGAPSTIVHHIGNIKYAPSFDQASLENETRLSRSYVLMASTHEDEERRIANAWIKSGIREHLLVIAPRHPQRTPQILQQLLPITTRVAVRSRGEEIAPDTTIYLADTLGELPWLMHHAELVFMGGSLIPRGGHNLLEPAQLGKAIVVGPHTENFAEERALLEDANALRGVFDEYSLVETINSLANNPTECRQLERNALTAVAKFEGIAQTYVDSVLEHCNA